MNTTTTISPERLSAAAAFKPVSSEQIARAKAVDVYSLASKRVTLHVWKGSEQKPREWAGPCPVCKDGTDRFHVTRETFLCRQCPVRMGGDAIDFIKWVDKVDFRTAVEMLTGDKLPEGARLIEPVEKSQQPSDYDWQSASWQRDAQKALTAAQAALWDSTAGRAGRAYLEGRGLHSGAWVAYGLGYSHAVGVKGKKVPAIAIPWFVQGTLRGIRYRLLERVEGHKMWAFYGSRFSKSLFGGQIIHGVGKLQPTLIICEGELNAVSIWQVAS